MNKKTVRDIDLKGKKVFVRCDFNVPLDENGNITDNRRIVAALPTINYLLEQNCKIILASHLGRPKGEFNPEFSLKPVAKELSKLLGKEVKLVLPIDNIIADEFSPNANAKAIDSDQIPDGWEGLDIGPKTVELFKKELKGAKTIIWNGPVGLSEYEKFANGTRRIAQALAEKEDAITIIGGGDSAAAIEKMGLSDKMTHISTGGGASLEFLEGKKLPGIECLLDNN